MKKENQIMNFLTEHIFNPILCSPVETNFMKKGVNITIAQMENMRADEMVRYFWSSIVGLERSTHYAKCFRKKEFVDVANEFGERFSDEWLKEPSE